MTVYFPNVADISWQLPAKFMKPASKPAFLGIKPEVFELKPEVFRENRHRQGKTRSIRVKPEVFGLNPKFSG